MGNESNKSSDELKNILKFPKYNLNDKGKVIGLKDGKIAVFSDNIINIYEENSQLKIQQIKIEDNKDKIMKVIQLDNNDLILHIKLNYNEERLHLGEDIIKIYKLNNGEYDLFQSITDDKNDYHTKKYRSFCQICKKIYEVEDIKKLLDNRFMILSSLGFKLYSYSEKDSKYLSSLMYQNEAYKISNICEVNNNELIIISEDFNTAGIGILFPSLFEYDKIFIDKYNIKNQKEKNIWNKKFKFDSLVFTNYVFLKNKYLIIRINESFYIFDVINDKKLIKYLPTWNNSQCDELYSWKSVNDDTFLSIKNDKINLIQFNNTWNSLKVIESYSFNNINKIENINGFYFHQVEDKDIKSIDLYYN